MELFETNGCQRNALFQTDKWIEHQPLIGRGYTLSTGRHLHRVLSQNYRKVCEPTGERIELHPDLQHITVAIEKSRWLLELKPGWDGENSANYAEETWDRAVQFLVKHSLWLWRKHSIIIDAPEIAPGPHGSIDLLWRTSKYELLVNIPTESSALAGFYGDDRGKMFIKGKLDTSAYNKGLMIWLMDIT